jgi:hypothetical protein
MAFILSKMFVKIYKILNSFISYMSNTYYYILYFTKNFFLPSLIDWLIDFGGTGVWTQG